MTLKNITTSISKLVNPQKAKQMQKFFKTGPGQYAQGDIFVGLSNPQSRQIAKQNKNISFEQLQKLISSKIHEQRFIALVILTLRFKKQADKCFNFYMNNLDFVNNWDLVDCSSYKITGEYLYQHPQKIPVLYELVQSGHLWRKRVAMISTLAFIKKGQNQLTYKISKLLLKDKHDLIHKAVGWMLRQTGKQEQNKLQIFIQENYQDMHRTSLRYAIQKFPQAKRQKYLSKQF